MIAQHETDGIEHPGLHHQHAMMKGKRTKRSRTASPFRLTMGTASGDHESSLVATSSSSASTTTEEEEDMANCLIMLAQGASKVQKLNRTQQESPINTAGAPAAGGGCVYECKTCSRCFSSFQALGGHRASHRKPKSPALSLADDHRPHQDYFPPTETSGINKVEDLGLSLQISCNSSNTLSARNNNHHHHNESNTAKLNKVHACAICGAEFSSGQALGGHMRRHRPIATSSSSGGGSQSAKFASPPAPAKNLLCLDLNLPAAADEPGDQQQQQSPESAKFIFGSNEKTLVFANSLVDCRY